MAFADDFVAELAARVAARRHAALAGDTRDALARRLFDLAGAIAAGLQTAETQATLAVLRRTHASAAPAFLLGALTAAARSTELDDIDLRSCTTPGAVVVPAALVAARMTGASTETLAAAVLAGYDVMTALGLAIDGATAVYGSRWPTYFGAAMSAAAVVSVALGFDAEQTLTALSIAASMTTPFAGRIAVDPISRWLTVATAAQAGLASAIATAEGLHGDVRIFSVALGLEEAQTALARRTLGERAFERTSAKPYCTGRQSLAAIEAFRQLVRDGAEPERIERIEVTVPEAYRAMIDRATRPRTKSESRGVRYQLALAAYYPAELYDIDRRTLRVDEPRMVALMDRVDVRGSDALTQRYPAKWPGAVRVVTASGEHSFEVVAPHGDPERPLSWNDVEQKLQSVAAHLPAEIPIGALRDDARTLNYAAVLDCLAERCLAPAAAPQQ